MMYKKFRKALGKYGDFLGVFCLLRFLNIQIFYVFRWYIGEMGYICLRTEGGEL